MMSSDPSDHIDDDDLVMVNHPPQQQQQSAPTSRREKWKGRLQKVGQNLQKLNLAKLIDDMEHDQELADQLEDVNRDLQEEADRKQLVAEATAACHAEIEQHLDQFLAEHPSASYEDWIRDVHPENVQEGRLLEDLTTIDLRFYVADSDHRQLWNARNPDRIVPARTYRVDPSAPVVDWLDVSYNEPATVPYDD